MKRDHFNCPGIGGNSATDDTEERWRVKYEDEEYNLIASCVDANAYASVETEVAIRNCKTAQHMPVIDIDHQCFLFPSETAGHFHFYIDVPMSWDHYVGILEALATAGVIEVGYLLASKHRGATFVAPKPWKEKANG